MRTILFSLAMFVAVAGMPQTAAAQAAPERPDIRSGGVDPWAPFAFMIGDWIAGDSGPSSGPGGEFTLHPDLDGKVLIRRNHALTAAGTHDDLMIIYGSGSDLRAFYVDNEGHSINYSVAPAEAPPRAVFLSDEIPGAPRFRLTYTMSADSTLKVDFDMSMPGGELKPYLSGTARRR